MLLLPLSSHARVRVYISWTCMGVAPVPTFFWLTFCTEGLESCKRVSQNPFYLRLLIQRVFKHLLNTLLIDLQNRVLSCGCWQFPVGVARLWPSAFCSSSGSALPGPDSRMQEDSRLLGKRREGRGVHAQRPTPAALLCSCFYWSFPRVTDPHHFLKRGCGIRGLIGLGGSAYRKHHTLISQF